MLFKRPSRGKFGGCPAAALPGEIQRKGVPGGVGRRTGLLALLTMMLFLWPAVAGAAGAADGVRLTATVGFDGRVKPAAWVPLVVEIENNGQELQGELVWDHTPQYGPPAPYQIRQSLPVALPAGGKKRFMVYAPTDHSGQGPVVRLLVAGQEIAQQKLTFQYSGDVLVGLLGPDREDVATLAALRLPNGRSVQLVKLDGAAVPDRTQALQSLDMLVVSNFSAAELTAAQRQAVQDWVREGGLLVLVGGPEARKTLTPWQPWLPIQSEGQVRASLAPLGAWVETPLAAETEVSRARITGARVLAAAGDIPLAAIWDHGAGAVAYLAYDPTLQPVHGWAGSTRLWERLLLSTPIGAQWEKGDRGMNRWQNLAQAAQQLPVGSMPSLRGLATSLLVYVLVLGPVNFLVLRRLRRAEWAWVTIPVLVLLFSGGTWLQSRSSAAAKTLAHQVSVVELDHTDTARVRTILGVFLPAQVDARVEFDRQMPLEATIPYAGSYRSGGGENLPVGVEIGGGGTGPVRLHPLGLWTMRAIGSQATVPSPGQLETVLTLGENGLTGTVTNQTDLPLKGVAVIYGTGSALVGELAPGQSAQVSLDLLNNQPQEFGPNALHMALRRAYQPNGWQGGNMSDEEAELFRRMNLAEALNQVTVDPGRPLVIGWADWAPGGVSINGVKFQPYLTAAVIQPGQVAVGKGNFTLPAGVLQGRLVAWDGQGYVGGPDNWSLPMEGTATVDFDLPVAAAAVQAMDLHVPLFKGPQRPGDLRVELWDWQAGTWREFAFDGRLATVAEPQRFVNATRKVRARIGRNGQEPFPTGIPSLALTGRVN